MITVHNPITQSSTDLLMLLTALIKSVMVVGFVDWFVFGFVFFNENCCQGPRQEGERYENSQAMMSPEYFAIVSTVVVDHSLFLL